MSSWQRFHLTRALLLTPFCSTLVAGCGSAEEEVVVTEMAGIGASTVAGERQDESVSSAAQVVEPAEEKSVGDELAEEPVNSEVEGETAENRRVFATSTRYSGALGGPSGADGLCAERAAAAGLTGEFRAWLSTRSSSVDTRLRQESVPYVRLDGVRVADNWSDLVDGSLQVPISVDELGASASGDVWTGTLADGTPWMTDDCEGFTVGAVGVRALCGSSRSSSTTWTDNLRPSCSVRLRLYCIEQ